MDDGALNIVGTTVGSYEVVKQVRVGSKGRPALYLCRCKCGRERVAKKYELYRGRRMCLSCSKTKHGHGKSSSRSPEYYSWQKARERCSNPKNHKYPLYGARGIRMCERWEDFRIFLADMGPRPIGHTLDRIDRDGNYEPGNCRWATPLEQATSYPHLVWLECNGVVMIQSAWARRLGVKVDTVRVWRKKGIFERRCFEILAKNIS